MTNTASTGGPQDFPYLGPLPSYLTNRKSPPIGARLLKQWKDDEKARSVSCVEIAKFFWGEPTSTTTKEYRWRTHGSRCVNLEKNVWFDHELNQGGNTIGLVERELSCNHEAAVAWLLDSKNYSAPSGANGPSARRLTPPLGPIVATYDYLGEDGNLLFQVVRHDQPKEFRQRRPDGNGGWLWSVRDVRQVPYRLPELRKAIAHNRTVLIVEGEKDADNLRMLGFAATCNAGGANKWRPELSQHLRGAHVVLVPDNDDAGRLHMNNVGLALTGYAGRIRIMELAGVPDKGDISDWLTAGGNTETLSKLIVEAPEWAPRAPFHLAGPKREQSADEKAVIEDKSAVPQDTAHVSSGDAELDGEIKRLSGLPPAQYEHERQTVAEKFKLRRSVLDELVGANRGWHGDDGKGHALKLFEPEPWPHPVNGSELLDKLIAALLRYVIMSLDQAIAVALWILHSYVFDAFMCTPRLCIRSPEKRCGKTTLLDVIGCLVNRPLQTANITSAALFRTVELTQPTVLFDEADNAFARRASGANGSSSDLLAVLNSGHRFGGSVTRTVGDDHEPRTFKTHTPVVMALIGKAPGTLADRSIDVRLRRKHVGEVVVRFRIDRTEELHQLARQARRWTNDNRSKLSGCDPDLPSALFNRVADNWRPLVAIADTIGGPWSAGVRAVAVKSVEAENDDGRRIMLLADIRMSFTTRNVDRLSSDQIVSDLTALEGRPWPDYSRGNPITKHQLARQLEYFEIRPKVINFGKDKMTGRDVTTRGYLRSMFDDAFARYLPSQTVTP